VGSDGKVNERILVLGSSPHTRLVTAYTWDKLSPHLNVADYDVVICNLTPLRNREFARSVNLNSLPSWQQFARLLFSEKSEIVFIGPPSTFGDNPYMPVTMWLPATPKFVFDTGEEIREVEPDFAYYFQHVRRWTFHTTSQLEGTFPELSPYLQVIHPQVNDLCGQMKPIAQTRFHECVAFALHFQALRAVGRHMSLLERALAESEHMPTTNREVIAESGSVIWLPEPTEISAYEGINLILRERYGLALERLSPTWAQSHKLPQQLPLEAEILKIEQGLRRLTESLAAARERLQGASRFQRLLYEQGEDGLEPVVRDAFRELGAQVEDPKQRGREDGRLVDSAGRKGILEIKGLSGPLKLKDVRELHQWVADAIVEEDWQGKGILVANTYCGIPPGQREDPFPDNCVRTAERVGLCLMTSTQLFRALCAHQCGKLNVAEFWNNVFNTDGVCSLPELEADNTFTSNAT